ncbi:MAK32 protein [Colletotrichum tofieldiae]|uniref:MAK32 protein n=1 Tax=Colletotrichum tofieldiae TaxID=708197 RepID=A0A166TPI8_9PEZI|nr:MAK32 protein [Colletotrichum tofieldiae]GKT59028.1 MAK32 protein [Colletotrichum tofieldiae]GKT80258.1 MAK32 protein [Colletotrichum tofieldiae]GKT85172.1 MAK32 protein [Colletotrichum tofieldiae]
MADADSQKPPEQRLTDEEFAALPPVDFVTLGMFIIDLSTQFPHSLTETEDEIHFLPPTPPVYDILGGAGSYGALGARLFSPPPHASSVGWIVDKGSDFPQSLTNLISSWGTSVVLRDDPERLTTRGWNGYENAEKRAFSYTTPKKRLTAGDLTPHLLLSKSFHLICSPTRCRDLVAEITSARKRVCPPDVYTKPIFIWEPVPDLCTPDELLNCTNTLPLIDICSPNHSELAGFMGDDGLDTETGEISKAAVERSCEQLLASMPLSSFTLVIRAGDKGCYVARNGGRKRQPKPRDGIGSNRRKKDYTRGGLQPDTDMEALFAGLLQDDDGVVVREEIEVDSGTEQWIPAVHNDRAKVVDPTGGGNTFLGGLAVALARGKSVEDAAIWGSVAASFAIEQVGVPQLDQDEKGNETWNGVSVEDRLAKFKTHL